MSARKKRWILRDPAPADFIASARDRSPIVTTLLYQRDLRDQHSVDAFLSSDYTSGLHDPFLMKGMDAAARRVAKAIAEGEPIAVYGDFDTDGVTAVTLLMQAITAMGGEIRPYIPHRLREGYGLNIEAVDQLAAEGIRVLITVDCGISNLSEVAHAQAHEIDVVVTDHHTPPDALPQAYALVNPKQPGCAYPYKQLVGVGIAYKLTQALARLGMKMPLRGLNATQRPGLKALSIAAGLVQGKITSSDISFMLGPRLNAAGRIDDAVLAYQLLLAENFTTAQQLADKLNQANRRRQELTKEIQLAARQQVEQLGKNANRIIMLDSADYPAGLVGLVAARLVEELGRPVLMLERGAELSRGSARSVPGFSIIDALTACEDLFVRFGGHSGAAGFTIANDQLPKLEERLLSYAAAHLPDELLMPALEIDAEVPLGALTWDLLEQIAVLEPFGQANPQPVLMSRRVRVAGAWSRGADGQHLKLRLDGGHGGQTYEAIAFRLGQLAGYFEKYPWLDIAYTLEANEWNGTRTLQLNIKDLRRAQ